MVNEVQVYISLGHERIIFTLKMIWNFINVKVSDTVNKVT